MMWLGGFLSLLLVAFGEPTCSPTLGLFASLFGFVPLFLSILDRSAKERFWIGCLFFTLVQLLQLFWLTSHPYAYIYAVWILLSFLMGLQFGALSLFITRTRLQTLTGCLFIPAFWTLMEWIRLFLLSGFTFNPVGMMATGQIELLQIAAFAGIYGLTFFVMLLNSCTTSLFLAPTKGHIALFFIVLLAPLGAGFFHIQAHDKDSPLFKALIVETRKLPEEISATNLVDEALSTWIEIQAALTPYQGGSYNLIMMPEIVVPFAAEAPVYELKKAESLFRSGIPPDPIFFNRENVASVSAFAITKEIATAWNTPILIGLEGAEFSRVLQKNRYFNSVYFVRPNSSGYQRYDKQILLPMAEEIPMNFVKPLAEQYGLFDSFQRGKGPVLINDGSHIIAPSVCYEDTFSPLMRENVRAGATLLANVTNDGWYPNSKLADYHFELARLRAVENGTPLIRSCNFGVSGAFDAFGRTVAAHSFQTMTLPVEAFVAEVPTNHFPTPYTWWGNWMIVVVSCTIVLLNLSWQRKNEGQKGH